MCDEHLEHFQNTQNMFSNVEAFCFRWMPRFLPDDFGALPLFFTMLKTCFDFGFFVWNQRLKVGVPWTLELSKMCSFLQGNIEELLHVNLDGRAVAAVEDCSQKLETYFDFEQLKTIQAREEKPAWVPKEPIDPQTCVFNRGVLVIDTKHWLQENLTEAITWWMDQFQSADEVLYKYGLSQPPFLLSLYGKYEKLPGPWNVRGLGRKEFSDQEREYMFKAYGSKPDKQPFLSPHADVAKILHFNGKYKPWKRGRPVGKSTTAVSRCGPNGQDCAELWWEYAGDLMDTVLANPEDDTDIPLEG
jgi:hypothetical protein